MIDIIIPAFNNYDGMIKTLASIAIQTYQNKVKVYIVNNGSRRSYKKEIDLFKDKLNITEFKLDKKVSPGEARNYAIERSDGKYIIFIQPEDQLYNCLSLDYMYTTIEKENMNVAMGQYYNYFDNVYNANIVEDPYDYYDLFGKIYRRKFIIKYNIKFNDLNVWEDDAFQALVLSSTIKHSRIYHIVYVHKDRAIEEDEQIESYIYFLKSRLWTAQEYRKRRIEEDKIFDLLLTSYMYVYKEIYNNGYDAEKIYENCWDFEKEISKYEDRLTDETIDSYLEANFEGDVNFITFLRDNFNTLRDNFRRFGDIND